jgi:hypothetical protein
MDLLLRLLGLLALLSIGSLAVFILFLRYKWKAMAQAAQPTPSAITLALAPEADWIADKAANSVRAELAALGYDAGPAYDVPELPSVRVRAFCQPALHVLGAYYDHDTAGRWLDLCVTLADGTELTVSNAPDGGFMDVRPGTEKIYLKGYRPAELHERLLQRLAGGAGAPVRLADFEKEFQAAYAREMAWRNQRQGVTPEEFQRIATRDGQALNEDQLKEAYKLTKLGEIKIWSEEALTAFEQTTRLSVAEWKKYEDRMFVHRDDLHAEAYLDYVRETLEIDEKKAEAYRESLAAGLSLRGLLKRIAEDDAVELAELGAVEQPGRFEIIGIGRKA